MADMDKDDANLTGWLIDWEWRYGELIADQGRERAARDGMWQLIPTEVPR